MPSPPFSRLPVSDIPSAQRAVSDLYDKLNVLAQSQVAQDNATASLSQTVNNTSISNTSTGGGSSSGGGTLVTILPKVIQLPSPSASQDGEIVDYGGSIWRFDASLGTWIELTAAPNVIEDTHAHRANYPAANYDIGTLYIETDRTSIYINELIATVPTWVWIAGNYFAALSSLPGDLGTADVGFLFSASDYLHQWRWNGSAWHFAPGDTSSYIVAGISAPNGGLWQLCDGSAVAVAQDNATTASVTTPNLTGDIFIQGGTYTGTRKTAAAATWDPAAVTDFESTHTHPMGQISITTVAGSDAVDISNPTGAGSAHKHGLSNANALLNVPSETNGGVPLRIDLQWYLRR